MRLRAFHWVGPAIKSQNQPGSEPQTCLLLLWQQKPVPKAFLPAPCPTAQLLAFPLGGS